MASDLVALRIDANAPHGLARFWVSVLRWNTADDGLSPVPTDDTGFRIRFLQTHEQKSSQNLIHFHLTSSSLDDQQRTVARSLELGGRHIDVGQRPEEGHAALAGDQSDEADRFVSLGARTLQTGPAAAGMMVRLEGA